MRTLPTSLLSCLAVSTLVAGCLLPNGLRAPNEVTVSSLLAGSGMGRLVNLKAGEGGVALPLSPNRSAMFSINAQSVQAGAVEVAITADGRAYKTMALPEAAPSPAPASSQAAAPSLANAHSFEPWLRAWERPLRQLTPRPGRYRLAETPGYALGDQASFWVIADSMGNRPNEVKVAAQAAYVGEHCYVFIDQDLPIEQFKERAELMGRTFDTQIFPTDSKLFGEPVATGVNGDPRITLLVSPAVGNYGEDTTIGYFTVRDLFKPEDSPGMGALRRSNRRLMLYLSSDVVAHGDSSDYLGTVAHEFEHLINASRRLFQVGASQVEDVWLDEGLAMYAMEANGYGLGGAGGVVFSHVAAYQADPGSYSLTNWDIDPDQSAYGAAYLYTTYLVERFGEGILKRLIDTSEVGVDNVQKVLGSYDATFEGVFEDWTAANMLDDTGVTSDPRFGYKSLNLLGSYGGRRLRGMTLEPVRAPNVGLLDFVPHSARYFYVPGSTGGSFNVSLSAQKSQRFGGWLLTP